MIIGGVAAGIGAVSFGAYLGYKKEQKFRQVLDRTMSPLGEFSVTEKDPVELRIFSLFWRYFQKMPAGVAGSILGSVITPRLLISESLTVHISQKSEALTRMIQEAKESLSFCKQDISGIESPIGNRQTEEVADGIARDLIASYVPKSFFAYKAIHFFVVRGIRQVCSLIRERFLTENHQGLIYLLQGMFFRLSRDLSKKIDNIKIEKISYALATNLCKELCKCSLFHWGYNFSYIGPLLKKLDQLIGSFFLFPVWKIGGYLAGKVLEKKIHGCMEPSVRRSLWIKGFELAKEIIMDLEAKENRSNLFEEQEQLIWSVESFFGKLYDKLKVGQLTPFIGTEQRLLSILSHHKDKEIFKNLDEVDISNLGKRVFEKKRNKISLENRQEEYVGALVDEEVKRETVSLGSRLLVDKLLNQIGAIEQRHVLLGLKKAAVFLMDDSEGERGLTQEEYRERQEELFKEALADSTEKKQEVFLRKKEKFMAIAHLFRALDSKHFVSPYARSIRQAAFLSQMLQEIEQVGEWLQQVSEEKIWVGQFTPLVENIKKQIENIYALQKCLLGSQPELYESWERQLAAETISKDVIGLTEQLFPDDVDLQDEVEAFMAESVEERRKVLSLLVGDAKKAFNEEKAIVLNLSKEGDILLQDFIALIEKEDFFLYAEQVDFFATAKNKIRKAIEENLRQGLCSFPQDFLEDENVFGQGLCAFLAEVGYRI